MKRRIVLASLVLILIAGGVSAGLFWRSRSKATSADKNAAEYTAVRVTQGTLSTEVYATGNVDAPKTVDVYPEKSGVVAKILVAAGDEVKAGDTLIELQANETDAQAAEATVRQRRDDVALAQDNLNKIQSLHGKGAATDKELRTAESSLLQAQDNLASAELKLNSLLTAADDGVIKAPIDGIVKEIKAAVGGTVSSSSSVVTLVDPSQLALSVKVDEYDIEKIKMGQQAEITLDAVSGETFRGSVSFVGKLGTTQSGVVVYDVSISIDNPSAAVKPGMSAEATIIVERAQNVLIVPNNALEVRMGRYAARVLGEDGGIQYKMVTIGMRTDSGTEIVSGLALGDTVAVPATKTVSSQSTSSRTSSGPQGLVGMEGIGAMAGGARSFIGR